jgi:hypothetical protein
LQAAKHLALRYIKEESKYFASLAPDTNAEPNPPRTYPFELRTLDTYSTGQNELRRDEELFECNEKKINQLVLLWRDDVYKKAPSSFSYGWSSSWNSTNGSSGAAETVMEEDEGDNDHFDTDMVDKVRALSACRFVLLSFALLHTTIIPI